MYLVEYIRNEYWRYFTRRKCSGLCTKFLSYNCCQMELSAQPASSARKRWNTRPRASRWAPSRSKQPWNSYPKQWFCPMEANKCSIQISKRSSHPSQAIKSFWATTFYEPKMCQPSSTSSNQTNLKKWLFLAVLALHFRAPGCSWMAHPCPPNPASWWQSLEAPSARHVATAWSDACVPACATECTLRPCSGRIK